MAIFEERKLTEAEEHRQQFLADVHEGLSKQRRELPCKYFYDERGSQLFDAICELPEYYVTRTELSIMEESAGEMAEALGARCRLVEFGSGSSVKIRLLLDALKDMHSYVPFDISREHLLRCAEDLAQEYPDLAILPVTGDYHDEWPLPERSASMERQVFYFPGSTIGNFHPDQAAEFLGRMHAASRPGDGLLIGVDLRKDADVLRAAYNDAQGVTAEFNRNLLHRMAEELNARVDADAFSHEAVWLDREGRIEMHLISDTDNVIGIGARDYALKSGERILTECSYKYAPADFAALAAEAGYSHVRTWTDARRWFAVMLFENR